MNFEEFLKQHDAYINHLCDSFMTRHHVAFNITNVRVHKGGGEIDAGITATINTADCEQYRVGLQLPHKDNFFVDRYTEQGTYHEYHFTNPTWEFAPTFS